MANHPVHLFDSDNVGIPSALIPFCAYGTDMKALGRPSSNFSFPVCDSFKPTMHKGRVCYRLDSMFRTRQGIAEGLTLMIDRNRERSVHSSESKRLRDTKIRIRLIEHADDNSAEVYLPLLAPHTFSRPGKYYLSSLKKMTGTEDFLKLPLKIKDCYEGSFEDCENAKLLEASQKECGCLPWILKDVIKHKVGWKAIDILYKFHDQGANLL